MRVVGSQWEVGCGRNSDSRARGLGEVWYAEGDVVEWTERKVG